jgi:ankyrin repeat protein
MADGMSNSFSRKKCHFFDAICSFPTEVPTTRKKGLLKKAESALRRKLSIIQNFLEHHDPNFAEGGEFPLSKAALLPKTLVLEKLLESDKVEINWSPVENGRTALSWAAEACRAESVNLLLNKGSDCYLKDKNGRTALSWAVAPKDREKTNADVIESLLEKGSCINSTDNSHKTPLSWAVSGNCMNTVIELLKNHDIQVDRPDIAGRTPLSLAAELGHIDIIRLLVSNGARVESKDSNMRTPLSWAGTNNYGKANDDVIKYLLGQGSDINAEDSCKRTPLFWAVSERCLNAIEVLLTNKDIQADRPEINGQTPLLKAAISGDVELMIRLLESGKIDISQVSENQKSFQLLLRARNSFLLMNPIYVDIRMLSKLLFRLPETLDGRTLMSWTVEYNDLNIAKLLLEKKNTRIDDGDDEHTTPLIRALEKKSLYLIQLLVPRDKISMILLVREAGQFGERKALELVHILLEYHYDANYIDDNGNTPLHLACYNDNPTFVSALVPVTNHANSPNHDDKTPMQIAIESKSENVIKLLFEEGIDFNPEECSDLINLEGERKSYVQFTTGTRSRNLCWESFAKNFLECVPNIGESRLWYVFIDYGKTNS